MRVLKSAGKIILSGMLAAAILCLIFSLYYSVPVHEPSKLGNTDYVWPENARWFNMREGISHGQYDENGFNNLNVVENPDLLILGSSHMEAIQVLQYETTGTQLSKLLGGQYSVYNMGISGHTFIKICKYLSQSLSLGNTPPKVVAMETSTLSFSKEEIDALQSGNVEFTPSHNTGLIAKLQKLPFFRIAYLQLTTGLLDVLLPDENQNTPLMTVKAAQGNFSAQSNLGDYDVLFGRIAESVGDRDIQVIIFYHPMESFSEDGTVSFAEDAGKELFEEKCREYGYTFLDMTEPFLSLYGTEHKVPHGFATGQLGVGHLNRDGHRVIAQELARTVLEMEECGVLCR